jgi:TonB family protein
MRRPEHFILWLGIFVAVILTLFSLNGFSQVGGSKCISADSLVVSDTFDRRQYLNSDDGARPPKALETPAPEYSVTAFRRGLQGTVVLAVGINKNGDVDKMQVVRRLNADLDKVVAGAVMQWKFAPAEKDGEAVSFQFLVAVSFGCAHRY